MLFSINRVLIEEVMIIAQDRLRPVSTIIFFKQRKQSATFKSPAPEAGTRLTCRRGRLIKTSDCISRQTVSSFLNEGKSVS